MASLSIDTLEVRERCKKSRITFYYNDNVATGLKKNSRSVIDVVITVT